MLILFISTIIFFLFSINKKFRPHNKNVIWRRRLFKEAAAISLKKISIADNDMGKALDCASLYAQINVFIRIKYLIL
jgi:hypothetical protein